MANQSVTLIGLDETMAALKAAGASSANLTATWKDAAEIVVQGARRTVPYRSGALSRSMRGEGKTTYGLVIGDLVYAGLIHFGFPTRGLGRRGLGDVRGKKNKGLAIFRQGQLGITAKTLRKASRQQARGARGGPIKPQPWIYEAWDVREAQVYDRFDQTLGDIERVFG